MPTILLALTLMGADKPQWQPLFDGRSLEGWKVVEFGGDGEVKVTDGRILMKMGNSLTGITYQGEGLPKRNYEIELDAMRVEGIDFFCGLTFPVGESHCSFIVGGWGGAVVGLSSIDDKDASENDTTRYLNFKTGQWYRIRLRVTDEKITAWLDDKQVVDQNIRGKKVGTRNEVDLSKPLGLSCWQTTAAIRNVRLRKFPK